MTDAESYAQDGGSSGEMVLHTARYGLFSGINFIPASKIVVTNQKIIKSSPFRILRKDVVIKFNEIKSVNGEHKLFGSQLVIESVNGEIILPGLDRTTILALYATINNRVLASRDGEIREAPAQRIQQPAVAVASAPKAYRAIRMDKEKIMPPVIAPTIAQVEAPRIEKPQKLEMNQPILSPLSQITASTAARLGAGAQTSNSARPNLVNVEYFEHGKNMKLENEVIEVTKGSAYVISESLLTAQAPLPIAKKSINPEKDLRIFSIRERRAKHLKTEKRQMSQLNIFSA